MPGSPLIFPVTIGVTSQFTGDDTSGTTSVFSADKRLLAYNALLMLLFYLSLRRCMTLIGSSPCMDMFKCPLSIEWFTLAAGAVQAMVSIAVATVYRPSSTVDLLNSAHDVVLTRGENGAKTKWSHQSVAGAYAAMTTTAILGRLVAMYLAKSDNFAAIDILLVYLPMAVVPIVVDCTIISICCIAENVCRDTVDRLSRLAAACEVNDRGPSWAKHRAAHWRLETVWRDYWHGCQLVDRLSRCYGLDLAINLTVNMLLFIGYAYMCIMVLVYNWSTEPGNVTGTTKIYWYVALVCQLTCVSFRIVFISYQAEGIKQVVSHANIGVRLGIFNLVL